MGRVEVLTGLACWHTHLVPALTRQRQVEINLFKAIQCHTVRSFLQRPNKTNRTHRAARKVVTGRVWASLKPRRTNTVGLLIPCGWGGASEQCLIHQIAVK